MSLEVAAVGDEVVQVGKYTLESLTTGMYSDPKIVYREFSDMMELKLEDFRAKIIYNIEPEKIDIIPIYEIAK